MSAAIITQRNHSLYGDSGGQGLTTLPISVGFANASLEKRIDELGPALERIFKKLTDNDKRSEERANQMHRRVDPLIEKLSETRGEVSALKDRIRDASAAATIGGHK